MDIKKEIREAKNVFDAGVGTDSAINRILDILEESNENFERLMDLFNKHLDSEIAGGLPRAEPQNAIAPCPFCTWCIVQNSCNVRKDRNG